MDPAKPRHARAIAFSLRRDAGLEDVVVGDTGDFEKMSVES